MPNYEEQLRIFKEQWNLPEYTLEGVVATEQKFRYMDGFLMNGSSNGDPTTRYAKWLSSTLSIYFERKTSPNEQGRYMSSFDMQEFYNSFKALVQAKFDDEAKEKGNEPLQVKDVVAGKETAIKVAIARSRSNYQKTLPTIWQESLKRGNLKIETLQNITNNAYTDLGDRLSIPENDIDAKLTNLVAAREAMKQLRASRSGVWGWLWKVIFQRDQNRQEKEYLADLNEKINSLKDSYNIEAKVEELTGKTVFGKSLTAKTEAKEEIKENEVAQAEELPTTKVNVPGRENKLDPVFGDNNNPFTENVVDKSSKVVQDPQHNPPTITSVK